MVRVTNPFQNPLLVNRPNEGRPIVVAASKAVSLVGAAETFLAAANRPVRA